MSKQDDETGANRDQREAANQGDSKEDAGRPKANARGWAAIQQLPGGSKRIDARRNLPHGPLGGSGRKTNHSRSS